jgi:hypothetical protein
MNASTTGQSRQDAVTDIANLDPAKESFPGFLTAAQKGALNELTEARSPAESPREWRFLPAGTERLLPDNLAALKDGDLIVAGVGGELYVACIQSIKVMANESCKPYFVDIELLHADQRTRTLLVIIRDDRDIPISRPNPGERWGIDTSARTNLEFARTVTSAEVTLWGDAVEKVRADRERRHAILSELAALTQEMEAQE